MLGQLIVLVAASIKIARLPGEHAHAILFVVLVASLVHVALLVIVSFLPLAFTMFEAILEFSDVDAKILPLILALTLWLTHVVSSSEAVSIGEDI